MSVPPRLCVVDPSGGLCTTSGATNYYYDPDGQRIAKWQGQWGQPGGALLEDYVYDFSGNQVSAHNSSGILRNVTSQHNIPINEAKSPHHKYGFA